MKTLAEYILGTKSDYKYKIKIAAEMNDAKMAAVQRALLKYDIVNVSNISRTPIEQNPVDFPTISVSEVYIVEIQTGIPMSTSVARDEIASFTQLPVDRVLVCDENTSYKDYELQTMANQEAKYTVKMTDPEYTSDGIEPVDVYGDAHNKELVKAGLETLKTNPWDTALKKFKIGDFR